LSQLLEPASEFSKLAIANIETRNLTQAVVESWKPVVASALNEWARQRMLTAALTAPQAASSEPTSDTVKIVTTPEEREAFATIAKVLGEDSPIAFEDSASYFKIHVAGRRTWVLSRLQLGRKQPVVWVPLSPEETAPLVGGRAISTVSRWTLVTLGASGEVGELRDLFRAAYAAVIQAKGATETDDD
jgi:hypothetical protein